jgi:DNA-binding transcriptional ArsR family regulator
VDLNKTDKMILAKLREGRCTPRYLSKEFGKNQSYISQRLKKLKDDDIVTQIDRGLYTHSELTANKLDASRKIKQLTDNGLLHPSNKMDERQINKSQNVQNIDKKILHDIKRIIDKEIPESNDAQEILIKSVKILNMSGPLPRNKLEKKLYSEDIDYSSSRSLWESTIGRIHEEIPGLQKTDHGLYDFDEENARKNTEFTEDLDQW